MHVLITGNMGYVGPVVVRHLHERFPKWKLTGFDSGLFAHCLTTPGPLPERLLATQHFGDVRELPHAVLCGVDAVVHLAAISNDPIGNRFEEVTDAVNRGASLRLARLARDAGVRHFVYASSCSVYGQAQGTARRETDATDPRTAYARSKIATEEGLQQLDIGGMTTTCLRFATACGMSDRLRLDLVLNDFVAGAVVSRRIDVLSDGMPWRPLIDVRDMARAIEWAVLREPEDDPFLVVNTGRDEANYRIRDLASAVAEAVPGTTVTINPDAVPDDRSYRVDFSRFAQMAPKHVPEVSLGQSIRYLVEGLCAFGFSDHEFRESPQIRLRTLVNLIEERQLSPELRWQQEGTA